jgi:DNA-binding transcriptional regulator YdaS (Cro superfamily)
MTELGRLLGVTPQAIGKWSRVPAERCLEVERLTGISRFELRPDIYGEPPRAHRGNALAGAAA